MTQHLISITARPQPMNEWFDAKMDEAAKQVRIAEAAPDLLDALQHLVEAERTGCNMGFAMNRAAEAIAKATGGAS